MDMTGTMLLQQAAEDYAKENYHNCSPYQAMIFGYIRGYIERSNLVENQEAIWEDVDEIKEDQSPYAALLHIKQNFRLVKK